MSAGPLSPLQWLMRWQQALVAGRAAEVEQVTREQLRTAVGQDPAGQVLEPLWWHGLALAQWHQLRLAEALVSWRACGLALLGRPVSASPLLAARVPPRAGLDNSATEAALWRVLAALAQAGVHGFAHAGTALGLARGGHLLPWDKDLDVAMPLPEMGRADACLRALGWLRVPAGLPWTNLATYVGRARHAQGGSSWLTLDICGLALEPGTGRVLGGMWLRGLPSVCSRVLDYPVLHLCRQTSPSGPIWSLQDSSAWLAALYGEGWRVPDPDFDSAVSARNMRGFPLLAQNFAWSRITACWMRAEWARAAALVRQTLHQAVRHQCPDVGTLQDMARRLALFTTETADPPRQHGI